MRVNEGEYNGEFDNLLYYFAYNYHMIQKAYKLEDKEVHSYWCNNIHSLSEFLVLFREKKKILAMQRGKKKGSEMMLTQIIFLIINFG